MEENTYHFTTAWGPLSEEIIEMLANDIPDFWYTYEEEQGWGAEIEYTDGEETSRLEWDLPDWEETDHDEILFLTTDYQNGDGYFKKGYYMDWSIHEYLGDTLEEAIEEYNN